MTDDFGPMKETTKAMWSLGDYSLLAKQLEEASRRLVEACAISSGQEVLDVAAGNGNCAIAAARRGAHVVASDLTPAMVQLGQARSAAEGLDIEWVRPTWRICRSNPARFDCVTSVFGAMIAPRPEVVASEMFRVAKPGGTVGMANWTPDSLMKKMGDMRPGIRLPLRWRFQARSHGETSTRSGLGSVAWPPRSKSNGAPSSGRPNHGTT